MPDGSAAAGVWALAAAGATECCRIGRGLPRRSLRQPTDAAGAATRRVGHGRVQIALPAQVQIVHLALRLIAPQGLEHGIAQRQALRQLADHNIPIIALDFAAARVGLSAS